MKIPALLLAVSWCLAAPAEVVPYIHALTTQATLPIPAGKILVIEQIQSPSPEVDLKITYNNTGSGISATSGNLTLKVMNTNHVQTALLSLDRVIRVQGGWSIQNMEGTTTVLVGLAMDEADLYASVPNLLEEIGIEGQNAKVLASLASPRPALHSVETSTDLQTWTRDPAATIGTVGGPSQVEAVTAATEDVKAVRIQSRARLETP
jgi:hypothetical protein